MRATTPLAPETLSPALDRRRPVRLLELVGNTPLIDLSRLTGRDEVRLFAKAEFANPGGSVKDRPALAMVLDAERRGLFAGGRRLLDATSGNTGIAYAMIGAAMGIPVTLCLPDSASPERKKILRAYGAELRITDPMSGSDGAILEARRLAAGEPERWAYLDQYSNPRTGGPTTAPPAPRSGSRPAARSPISSPAWAPAAPSWVSAGI
jgi:cysteine synthase B